MLTIMIGEVVMEGEMFQRAELSVEKTGTHDSFEIDFAFKIPREQFDAAVEDGEAHFNLCGMAVEELEAAIAFLKERRGDA